VRLLALRALLICWRESTAGALAALVADLENKFFARAVPVYLGLPRCMPSRCCYSNHSQNVVANSRLVRLGVLADLVQPPVFVLVPVALYRLLKHGHPNAALASVALVTITTGITCLNAVFACENCLRGPRRSNADRIQLGSSSPKAICCICVWMSSRTPLKRHGRCATSTV
jgi:uncharacterized protein DUF4386